MSHPALAPDLPAPDAVATELFGARLELATRYAALLASIGVAHGHLGPREVPRIWERHLVNCALVADVLPHGVAVVDVGSGAGLPGLALAIRRPDLAVDLVEPMQRRVAFLNDAVHELGLSARVRVHRGRAEDPGLRAQLPRDAWVTARAVAALDQLVQWCLPLVGDVGRLVALKGASAAAELERDGPALRRHGALEVSLDEITDPSGVAHTWVVSMRRGPGRRRTREDRP